MSAAPFGKGCRNERGPLGKGCQNERSPFGKGYRNERSPLFWAAESSRPRTRVLFLPFFFFFQEGGALTASTLGVLPVWSIPPVSFPY